jgi:DmsE family decaheme c-type cytochrome
MLSLSVIFMKNIWFKVLGLTACVALLSAGVAVADDINWTELNPKFKGATFVKDPSACFSCHEDTEGSYNHTTHAQAFKTKLPSTGDCESCHGPRSLHIEDPNGELALTPERQGKTCLQCHEGGTHMNWKSSAHNSTDVSCTSCHTVMQKKSEKALLSAANEEALCYTCHSEVRGEMNKSSHHPVREGKMNCSDCHNPHGSVAPSMLKGNSVNETCYSCHQEKRGPYVWVHPPAQENCLTCHNAHGSNNRKLMSGRDAFVCLSCHTYGGHINLPRYNRVGSLYGEGCVSCHMAVHGSNSPSGAKLTR